MPIVLENRLRDAALALVDARTTAVETRSQNASGEFFEGTRTADLWKFCVEAQGELAVLRHRLEHGVPLDFPQIQILLNLTQAPTSVQEVAELKDLFADGQHASGPENLAAPEGDTSTD